MIGIGKRYILRGVLGKGGMGVVHRATDRLNREDVALKKVTTAPEQLTFNSQSDDIDNKLALAQEFRALATLRHPNIISVLDYGFDTDSRPYFTMELLDDPQTLINAGRNQSMDVKIDLLIQMLRALAYLHRRGIIHRDLKPSNLLVVRDMQNLPLLKVLDFGLSVVGKEDQKGSGGTTAGTLAYMAPEILQGAPVNNATDLYAVGIIAYELFSGMHPFDVQNIPKLIEDILKTYPDMSRLDVSEQVIVVLQRLMSKDPGGRYHDANQVIVDLCAATQHPLPQESAAIRDSFLQSARLVERDTELKILTQALLEAQKGKGSSWLVTGESGVGKSRLIDELRTVAMVQGMLTLRGQSTSSGDTTAELWRSVIRRLSVFTEISNEEASTIKTIVPDINLLLERTIPEVTISGGPVGERLFATVENIIQRLTNPTLLVLEDLHWADDNLELLIRLNAMVEKLPMVIVGSYRDDERPDLPHLLPTMKILKLKRLSENGIRELSTAMLGKAGERHHVVDLLQRETEGNVFFLVEVVRALAEEAGQLERIGMVTLPEQVFAGGVQQIVQRRLNRVPASSQYLLKLAAVGGRWLDLPVLEYALNAKQTRKSLATLLQECAAVAVFEVQDNQWRFVHDKLREAVLTNLTSYERPVLHGQMAEAIENVYENPVEKSAMLAQLWSVAGNREKQVDYLSLNGNAAMHNGATREAAEVFEQVLEQLEQLQPTPYHQRRYIDTAIKLTRVSPYAPHNETLKSQLERAYNYARVQEDESRQAEVLSCLGIFYHMRGQLREALYYFAQSAELAEQHQANVVLMQIYSYMGRSMFFAGQLADALPVLEKGIQLAKEYDSLELITGSNVYLALLKWFSGDKETGDSLAEQALESSETLAQPGLLAMELTLLATGAALCGWLERASEYLSKAIVIAEDQEDLLTVYIATLINGYIALQNEEMDKAFNLLEEAASLAQKQHIYLMLPDCMIWSAAIDGWYGNTPMARERIQVAEQLAEQTQQLLGLCEIYRVAARIYEGDTMKVKSYLDSSLTLARDLQFQPAIAATLYDLSSYYYQLGDTETAQTSLEEASKIARQLDMQIWLTRLDALRANL